MNDAELKRLLTAEETETELSRLNADHDDWQVVEEALLAEFIFRDFVQAFGFMSQAALVAERLNHHPEWSNVYKRVGVRLVTHESGGITALDFQLAAKMSQIAAELQG